MSKLLTNDGEPVSSTPPWLKFQLDSAEFYYKLAEIARKHGMKQTHQQKASIRSQKSP